MKIGIYASVSSVLALAVAMPAMAQKAPPTDNRTAQVATGAGNPRGSAGQASAGIEEIIVTAQRQAETSQRAAVAIDVLKPEALAQVTEPQGVSKLAPAVQFGSASGNKPLFYVRGVGTFASASYVDSAIAVNYDEVYLGRSGASFGHFYDLERIELLKGPQGTLYGRNATGGALNIIPAKPRLGESSVSGSLGFGNYDAVNAQAAVNVPISDTIAVRAAGTVYNHDGYNTDGTYSEAGRGGRLQVLFEPKDGVSLRVAGDYFHLGGSGPAGHIISTTLPDGTTVPTDLAPNVGPFDPQMVGILNSLYVPTAGITAGPHPTRPYMDNNLYGIHANLDVDLGFANWTVIGAWRRSENNDIVDPGITSQKENETAKQYSLETRLSGKVGAFDWLAGGYFYKEDLAFRTRVSVNVIGVIEDGDQSTTSYAGFGKLTWNLTDRLRLTGAARYTKDERTFDGTSTRATLICQTNCAGARRLPADFDDLPAALLSIGYVQPPGVPVYVDVTGTSDSVYAPSGISTNSKISPGKLTYRAAVEFEPGDKSLLYASVETGFRSGGFNFSTLKPSYGSETITAYTIGSKNRFLNNKLQINAEGFLWQYKNQQVSRSAISAAGAPELITENIGKSTMKGFEVDLMAKPLRNTLLHADIQYLDARNDNFVYLDADLSPLVGLPAGTVRPSTTCPASVVQGQGVYRVDCSGLRPLRSPKWTMNLGIQQSFDLSNDLRLTLEGNTHYQTSSIVMFERRDGSVLQAYWLSDASISLSGAGNRWTVTAYINNIENKRLIQSAFFLAPVNATMANFGPPRTYGARLSFNF